MNLNRLKHFFQFVPIRTIDFILCMLPRSWTLRLGELLGLVVSLFFPGRRRLMMKNLSLAFPEKSDREKARIIRGVWKNIGRVATEFIRLSDITRSNFYDYFDVVGEELLIEAKAQGKGIIFVGFHFANWEMSGVGGSFANDQITAIARPIRNPYIEKWIQKKRGEGGMDIILHRDAVRGCLRALKAKKAVGILVDQNLYTGGVFVNFFGRPAATTPLPALLSTRTQAPLLLLYCRRGENKMKLIYEKFPLTPEEIEGDQALTSITQKISDRLEEIIRSAPDNWFWVHNRWKRQP